MADAENTNFEFGIENFKPYADLQSIELGKITLIYGSNSSGKSSFIQSFLCAVQSSESPTCSLSLNGAFVDCGTFDTVLNRKVGDKKQKIVIKTRTASRSLESTFSIKKNSVTMEVHINFCPNFPFEFRSFFNKASTPGILEIDGIQILLPQCDLFESCDTGMQGAWMQAKKPLPHTKGLHCLEDIDGEWMKICTNMIRSIAEDFKQCLQELSCQKKTWNSGMIRNGYTIIGKLEDLNLLCCASLSIGAWISVLNSDVANNSFTAFVFPPSMPYLEGDYFALNNLGNKIRSLHENLCKYYSGIEDCLCKFSKVKYSLGNEYKASWGSIPLSDQSVEELADIVESDSNCISIENQIAILAKEINDQIDSTPTLGSSLMSEMGVFSERLINICRQLDKSTEALKNMTARSLISSSDQRETNNEKKIDAYISQGLTTIFQLSGESIKCLEDSFSLLISTHSEVGLDEIGDSFSEIKVSIDECKNIYDESKKIFGSFDKTGCFIDLAGRLSDQIKDCQPMIARKANNLDYKLFSGMGERSAIEGVLELINGIQQRFKINRQLQLSFISHESDQSANHLKLIPVMMKIKILPSHVLRETIINLGPDRPTPKRSYGIDEIMSDSQLQYLPEWDGEKEDLFPESHQNKYENELACLDIPGNDIVRVNTSDPMLDKCSIGILRGKEITNICDLGFGVSQVMPLVIASKIPDKDLIIVQQPETHLHPKMQADLGDLLIKSIDTKTWFIETHSEVLMLRILRRIREEKFSASDLKIYFVDQQDGDSKIIDMKFSATGDLITRWPKGFFAQESMEIF